MEPSIRQKSQEIGRRVEGREEGLSLDIAESRLMDVRQQLSVLIERTDYYNIFLIRIKDLDILNDTDPAGPLFIEDNHASSLSMNKHTPVGRTVKARSPVKKNPSSGGKLAADAAPTLASSKKVLPRCDCTFLHCEI